MLQILSYIPAIGCQIPSNLQVFLTEYLAVAKMTVPLKALPGFIPNPLGWLGDFLTVPVNLRFSICGYESVSFIYNFADQLLTWVLLAVGYIALCLLTSILPKSR